MAARSRTSQVAALTVCLAAPLVGAGAVPALAAADRVRAQGALVRYDTALVPEGATARVQEVRTASGSTVVTLHVRGLLPDREYGAHAHVAACGSTGAAAGPHYQDVVAPADHATDPAYANPYNEVWLDVTTDSEGNGSAQALVRWQFRAGGANSVILHVRHTATDPGSAGTAGGRLACLTLPF
jgi:superoxide dismutase, Cu-Zn family